MKPAQANSILDRLFSHISRFNKESSFIPIRLDTCILYIPVSNLDNTKISEFQEIFTRIYKDTRR